jgi:putative flavoprotein involved in K+ transport
VHQRGVTAVPGLYFLGLPWLHTWGSGRFSGVARDAEFLAEAIAQKRTLAAAGGQPGDEDAAETALRLRAA